MVLSPGQFYCVSLCKEKSSVQLDIILDRSTEDSAENRKWLIDFFQSTLEQTRLKFMAAAEQPIIYVKCPHCCNPHIKYTTLFKSSQICGINTIPLGYYQDLYSKLITISAMLKSSALLSLQVLVEQSRSKVIIA